MRYCLSIAFCFLFLARVAGQQSPVSDTAHVVVRQFSAEALQEYSHDSNFKYERSAEPPRSLWTRFWDWVWTRVSDLLSSSLSPVQLRRILVLLAVGIVVYFIIHVNRMTGMGLFSQKNTGDRLNYSVNTEDIHGIAFNEAIQQAVNDKNFKIAVRLLYLQSLKNLSDKGLINWQINKTNVTYVHELAGTTYEQKFSYLTRHFENNWYGDLPVSEAEFASVREQFNQFNHQLK